VLAARCERERRAADDGEQIGDVVRGAAAGEDGGGGELTLGRGESLNRCTVEMPVRSNCEGG
jgi:hypothetical protein